MSTPDTQFMSTANLVKLGRVNSAGAVADEMRQSLPIPRRARDGLRVDFFFCPAVARPQEPVVLAPPQFMITHFATGQLEELRAVTPADFGQSHRGDNAIGTFGMPEGMTFELFNEKLDALYAAYDVLLPAFDAGATQATEEVREAARRHKALFAELSEPPLLPYYSAAGKDFFAWVSQMAR